MALLIDSCAPELDRAAMKRKPVRVGVIAAAGKGTRAYPRTNFIPKPLFKFLGRTLLERNAELLFKTFGVKKLYVIVGHLQEQVTEEVERLQARYPTKEIEPALWTKQGLAADVAALRDRISQDFVLVLGDEFYHRTDHKRLQIAWNKRPRSAALIAVWKSDLLAQIRKNYSVELQGERVERLIEKPQDPPNNLVGLGTYVFTQEFFGTYDQTPPSSRSGIIELTDVIDKLARDTGRVYARDIGGRYYNINSLADYYAVQYELRSEQFEKYRISIVIPTMNSAATVGDVISDFKGRAAEFIVADMGSTDQTLAIARKNRARVIKYTPAGSSPTAEYGMEIYSAMEAASGDIIVIVPADGTFRAHDLPKLLEYLKDCDLAVGTRTTRQMIEQGANLRPLYRWLNVFFGKLVEICWWAQEPRYTDIGCQYRAIWKESFLKMLGDLRAPDRTYALEMMIETMRYQMRCVEVPVSYNQPYGHSTNESLGQRWNYFFSVLVMVFARRFRFVAAIVRLFSSTRG